MVVPGARPQHKRSRDELSSAENEHIPSAKRRRSNNYPPQFWDTLSAVRLTRGALSEFDRRREQTGSAPVARVTSKVTPQRILRSYSRRVKIFASDGGPDLSALRGYSEIPTAPMTMSQSSFDSRKRSRRSSTKQSSTTGKTKNTSPYDGDFEQKLIDRGIYPDGYEGIDGDSMEPENLMTIREALAKARSSLSPSQFPQSEFAQFKRQNRFAKSESQAVTSIIPYIAGSKDSEYKTAGTISFNNLKKFDPTITTPTPDFYYGASPSQIDARVRKDIGEYITPSRRTSVPAAPNYFRADKSASGRADVAQRQAMYDGAVGARSMHTLQNYGNSSPVYDNNAYTISSTYHPGTGTLQMYSTHPAPPAIPGGETQYYTTQLDSYAMTGNISGFRSGATAYRNGREWAKEQRDRIIASANAIAQRRSTETRSFGRDKDINVSSDPDEESPNSETSADELAPDYKSSVKRRRRERVSSLKF